MPKKEIRQHCTTKTSPQRSISPLTLTKAPSHMSILSNGDLRTLQSELRSQQGYSLTISSVPYLSLYCDYHSLLRSILARHQQKTIPSKGFLQEYSRMHSEQAVSKLYNVFLDKEHQMRRNSKAYSRQCLFDYFQLQGFTPEKIVSFLIRKIMQGRAKGVIALQERKKNKKTLFQYDQKENKQKGIKATENKNKTPRFQETKIYFSILALKMLLKEKEPNMQQINRNCEEIKNGLEEYLRMLKVRLQPSSIKSTRSSIFRRDLQK